jgi:6-phosphogluconolactonase (cycloisomerase 2 family)
MSEVRRDRRVLSSGVKTMDILRIFRALAASAALAGFGICSTAAHADHQLHPDAWKRERGIVYAMDNAAQANSILVFARDRSGRLHPIPQATARTGGAGGSNNAAVDPLGSQNSLVYDAALDMLFAVNAGDNTVTAFRTGFAGVRLQRTARAPSGGLIPVSVAVSDRLLYVLNAGGSGAVTTFAIGRGGQLTQKGVLDLGLANPSSLPFDPTMTPGQVGVDALARRIIVTNKSGQELLVAALDDNGIPVGALAAAPTPGPVPFAFGVTRFGNVLVAEASGSVSALEPTTGTGLSVTDSAPTGQMATCWIVVHAKGFAYVSNTGSNTISLLRYTRTGGLELLDDVAANTGGAPIDMTLAAGGRFLYVLNGASGEIVGFAIDQESGALSRVETQGGLPAAGAQGIAARDF